MTVVVGPNGSGKSNVVDAIGWVLGAQAPSAVRSQKMDDVIFAGTSKRPALGRAEVSLTIDNSAGQLPIDFTEVTITRLLFRSGDSEYAINGVPCRLLDIQELLSDSGVGRQQHVIISQGNIDGVLNARPEERRLIIEEAAGVLKYRRRKERAERRLTGHRGQPHPDPGPAPRGAAPAAAARSVRPTPPAATATWSPSSPRYGCSSPVGSWRGCSPSWRSARARRPSCVAQDQQLRAALADLDARVLSTEAQLSALGGRDVGDALVRYETLREKARGQLALLAERRRGVDRELSSSVDAGVIASLESEQAQLRAEADQAERDAEAIEVGAAELAEAEGALAEERAAVRGGLGRGRPGAHRRGGGHPW